MKLAIVKTIDNQARVIPGDDILNCFVFEFKKALCVLILMKFLVKSCCYGFNS